MQELELSLRFIKPMHKIGLDYMVTGSVAAMIYGEPRFTQDVDIVIDLKSETIESFHAIYEEREFYVPPIETLKIEAGRKSRGHFNLIDNNTSFKADIYLKSKDKLHEWAFSNRQKRKIDDDKIYFAPPEYVIIRKLIYYKESSSEKHVDDIRKMMKQLDNEEIKIKEIEEKIDEYNLNVIWKMI